MTRYLVYTPPSPGHVFPLVPGLLALAARGHSVSVRTAPHLVPVLREAGLDAAPIDPRIVAARRPSPGAATPDKPGDLMALAPIERDDLAAAIAQTRPEVLLVDAITYGAATHAEVSGLPWALTMPSVLPMPGRHIPPYGLGLTRRTDLAGRLRDRALWPLVERLFARSMLPGLNAVRAESRLPALRSPLDPLDRPDGVLVLTQQPLEYPRSDLPPHVHLVGAQVWDPPTEQPGWLAEPGTPWVLVTCSTDYQADEALARAAVEALRDEPVRVLLTLADAYDSAALPAASNVRVERFVPHASVLPHTAIVVSPAGMGIVQKSMAFGVPVVAVPFGRDQPEIARRVESAGLGVRLPVRRLTPDRLRDAVSAARAMSSQVRAVAATVDPAANALRFAEAAERLSTDAGRSSSSGPPVAPVV
ncbi:MAG TPA: glycosyltransferase [Nocardioidaceae bacterium]|jgi:MGT family glycosyltransferase|nr:glycosyltransferase [Nocardioidaceae bacterium]